MTPLNRAYRALKAWSVQGSNLRPPVYKGRHALGVTPTSESVAGRKDPQKTRKVAESLNSYDNDKTTVDFVVPDARDRVPPHLQLTVWKVFA